MRIPRIYEVQPLICGAEIILGESATQHLARVLRMQSGQPIVLFNGQGGEFHATLVEVTKRQVRARLDTFEETGADSLLQVHLGQCLSRGERMDYAVQKATELGVTTLTPIASERTEVRLKADRLEKRRQHWQQVAISASEQSQRTRVPEINIPLELINWVQSVEAELKLVLHPRTPVSLTGLARPASIALLIGPEGGLSEEEIDRAEQAGFKSVALGPRVLRTETAPVVALSVLQHLWGDLGN